MNSPPFELIFDETTLQGWSGPATGIPRVVTELRNELKSVKPTMISYVSGETTLASSEKMTWFFSAGATWNYQNILAELRREKARGLRIAHLVHDLIPIRFPWLYEPGFRNNFSNWLRQTAQLCDLIVCVSEATKRDLQEFCISENIAFPDVAVLRLGEKGFERVSAEPVVEGPFILSVGTLESRKNHQMLLDIFSELGRRKDTTLKLVLVGREGWIPNNLVNQIENDPALKGRVIHFSDLQDRQLARLYQDCLFTVLPSIYEGWGLPAAESLSFGKIAVVSDTGACQEISPELLLALSPYDRNAWKAVILDLAQNSEKLLEMNRRATSEYVRTTWSDSARQLLGFLESIGSRL